jgi:hypothetical protein
MADSAAILSMSLAFASRSSKGGLMNHSWAARWLKHARVVWSPGSELEQLKGSRNGSWLRHGRIQLHHIAASHRQRPSIAPPASEYFVPQTISSRLRFAAAAPMDKQWSAEMSRLLL